MHTLDCSVGAFPVQSGSISDILFSTINHWHLQQCKLYMLPKGWVGIASSLLILILLNYSSISKSLSPLSRLLGWMWVLVLCLGFLLDEVQMSVWHLLSWLTLPFYFRDAMLSLAKSWREKTLWRRWKSKELLLEPPRPLSPLRTLVNWSKCMLLDWLLPSECHGCGCRGCLWQNSLWNQLSILVTCK